VNLPGSFITFDDVFLEISFSNNFENDVVNRKVRLLFFEISKQFTDMLLPP